MFNKHDIRRNECQLYGGQAKKGYDWWWHSFTARDAETGEERPFFIEFFAINPASGKAVPVFGQLKENQEKGIKPSYILVKGGCWGEEKCQLHRFFGWKEGKINKHAPFKVRVDDCYLSEHKMIGSINISEEDVKKHPEWMCDAGSMKFDIKIRKKIAFNVGYGASTLFRKLQLFEMFWHAEGMKTEYEGYIIFNGRRYIVSPENSYGYADKNWGKDFTSPWVWLSSNDLVSKLTGKKLENSVFDIGGGCPKVGPVSLPRQLLSAFWYEGKPYEFNFSKFWNGTRTKFDCHETETQIVWHVEQSTFKAKMITDITCEKKDMLFVNYEAPDGKKRHNRLWNGGNGKGTVKLYERGKLVDEIIVGHVGCEYGEYGPQMAVGEGDTIECYKS